MSDEEVSTEEISTEEAAEETTPGEPGTGEAPDHIESDDNVTANWVITVIPNENVSIHYTVSPNDPKDAITSVTTSFTLMKEHMNVHTYAGSSATELIEPKAGQGSTGDCGVDASVFPEKPDGQLTAVLAGTVRKGEENLNYFFQKAFDPT